jgi:hypothetical protein
MAQWGRQQCEADDRVEKPVTGKRRAAGENVQTNRINILRIILEILYVILVYLIDAG